MGVKNNISIDDVAALRAAARHERGYRAFVGDDDDLYKFDPASVLADDGADVIRPDNILGPDAANPGRWLKIKFTADDLSGVVSGTGAADQVGVWSGVSTQDGSANLTFDGTTLAVIGGVTVTTSVSIIGATPIATTGSVRLSNTGNIVARNDADDGNLNLINSDSSDVVNIASGSAAGLLLQGGTGSITCTTDVVSDVDSTDSLGNTTFRWLGLFVDDVTITTSALIGGVTGRPFMVTNDGTSIPTETVAGESVAMFSRTSAAGSNVRVSIISGTTGAAILTFGDTADENAGFIQYNNNTDEMTLRVGGSGSDLILTATDFTVVQTLIANIGLTVNETATATGDLRVEGESLQRLLATDASAVTENLIFIHDTAPDFKTMDRGIAIGNSSQAPTGNPVGGGFLFIVAGLLKYLGPSGTLTEIAQP